jgi:hypothetical protein
VRFENQRPHLGKQCGRAGRNHGQFTRGSNDRGLRGAFFARLIC